MNELEIVQHPQIRGLHIFFNSMEYRTAHFHSEWELICPLDNELIVSVGACQHLLIPGDMMLIEPRELHGYHCVSDPCIFLCLQVSDDLYPSLRGMQPETLFPREYFSQEHYSLLKSSLLDLVRAYIEQAPQYELYCIGMTGLILHSLMTHMPVRRMTAEEISQRDRKNDRLGRFIQYVDRNFQGKILLRDFAKEEGLSMNYLSGFIRQTLNQSFQEYVAAVRFNFACERMVNTDDKLMTICMDSGFSDYRYFSEAIQKRTGKTPEEYRNVLRAGGHSNNLAHHSKHSREEFFTRKESLALCERFAEA